jgi:hypothetical protein
LVWPTKEDQRYSSGLETHRELTVETTETSSNIKNPTQVNENTVMISFNPVRCSFPSSAGAIGSVVVVESPVSMNLSLDAAMIKVFVVLTAISVGISLLLE